MGTKFRFLAGIALPLLTLCLSACSNSGSSTASGTGALFVATQGDSKLSAYSIDLSSGLLTANGSGVSTGNTPSAMILEPSGGALFVANSNSAIPPNSPACTLPSPGSIGAFTINSGGTPATGGASSPAGIIPIAMAMDSGAHFLFVANQGLQCDPASATISVFSISSNALTAVAGSPFPAVAIGAPSGTGPSGIAVTPDGKFLYVSNQFDSTITRYSVDASGVLTQGLPVPVGTAPSAMAITPDGGFLYVGNSTTVSAFAICGQVVTSCSDPTSPDGSLTVVPGSPFAAGLGPASIVVAPSGKFLYVANRLSNQISQFKVATGTGVLSPNTQAVIGTGANPVSVSIRPGSGTNTTTGGVTTYLYVANVGASSISVYSFDSTVGSLSLVGGQVATTGGQPAALAAE